MMSRPWLTDTSIRPSIQVALADAAESKQINMIPTNYTVYIMNDGDYVQKLRAQILNTIHVLSSLSFEVTP